MTHSIPLLAALTVAAVLVFHPAPAHAQARQAELVLVSGYAVGAPLELMFAIVDVLYFAKDRRMPAGWSVPELIYAEMLYAAGVITLLADVRDDFRYLAIPAFVLGTWHTVHAIWSLARSDTEPAPVQVGFGAAPGGASVSVAGRF